MKNFLYIYILFIALVITEGCGSSGDKPPVNIETDPPKSFILITTDGGETWKLKDLGQEVASHITFCEPSSYLMTVDGGPIQVSTDEGTSWTNLPNSPHTVSSISSGSPGNAVAIQSSAIYWTTDNGADWTSVNSIPTTSILTRVNMALDPIGYIAAYGSVLRTIDRGKTWIALANVGSVGLSDVDYSAGGSIILVTSTAGKLYRSNDAGITWAPILVDPAGSDLTIINFEDDGSTANCLTSSGKIFHSTDAGLTWADVSVAGVTASLTDIAGNYTDVFVVGGNGTILRSSDHGASWRIVPAPNTKKLTSIEFSSETSGIIVGQY